MSGFLNNSVRVYSIKLNIGILYHTNNTFGNTVFKVWSWFFFLFFFCFLTVRNCSFFMGIIFCSSVALVWTFNTWGVYNFITKEANILVNLVPFFNDVLFLLCRFLKSGVMNELKSLFLWKSKKVSYLFQTGQNAAARKTLVWSTYVWRTATVTICFKKE